MERLWWLLWWRPPCVLRTVIVNLKPTPETPDEAVQGVLWRSRGAWLVLVKATALKAGAQPAPLDGEVVVHRSNVSYLQVLP